MTTNEEKVEMADVPKDVDNEKPAAQEETTATKVKRSFFANLFAKKEKKDALLGGEEATTETDKGKCTKKKRWLPCPFKNFTSDTEGPCGGLTYGVNLLDRDEGMVNEHIKLAFEDILAEPDGYHSWDWVWRHSHHMFNSLRRFVYRVLAMLLAAPCAIVWALVFAILTCLNVWLLTPLARALSIPATWLAKTWAFLVRSICDPLFRSCALCRPARNQGFSNQPDSLA